MASLPTTALDQQILDQTSCILLTVIPHSKNNITLILLVCFWYIDVIRGPLNGTLCSSTLYTYTFEPGTPVGSVKLEVLSSNLRCVGGLFVQLYWCDVSKGKNIRECKFFKSNNVRFLFHNEDNWFCFGLSHLQFWMKLILYWGLSLVTDLCTWV